MYAGSSPLTRGKQSFGHRRSPDPGLIPAHAGKTIIRASDAGAPQAHPRSRGENSSTAERTKQKNGSSPLTRGKPRRTRTRQLKTRLIPAHAGKTSSHADAAAQDAAHPRSRGENVTQRRNATASGGSSPLTRGKLCRVSTNHRKERLIPAHAGKTRAAQPTRRRARAHPRSRGENRTGT